LISASDPTLVDSDGDGVSDRNEAIMGTLPDDANSVLRLTVGPVTAGVAALRFPTAVGRFYKLYASGDLGEGTPLQIWKDAGIASAAGNGSPANFEIQPAAAGRRRFYRLHVKTTEGPWPVTVP
jgi:hypothetical protein